jgi:large subunit ribosomal protein L5
MPAIAKEFKIENVMAIPTVEKVIINSGVGKAKDDNSILDEVFETITNVAGQRPLITKAKKAVSNFKIREDMPIGVKVTLRKERMWYFLDKLINIALPRTKDFRGVSTRSFDGNGNYSLGIADQTIFPEVDTSKNIRLHGLQISIITSAESDELGHALLKHLGMPFQKDKLKKKKQ